ncbi:hypothetical protein [Desulforegula conservatrix]|uniref:hypothetical protein n=1 Tax=Desulforegula conservatrix TaxID=153026 RepID=UPI0004046E41|nr:hypothetical protein [Desulforegula conservatrix]
MKIHIKAFKYAAKASILVSMLLFSGISGAVCIADDDMDWERNKSHYNENTGRSGYIGPRINGGIFAGDDFSNYCSAGLAFGYDIDAKQSIELDFALAKVETDGDGPVTSLFRDDPQILIAAINYRYFFTPRHSFPGLYFLSGLAYNGIYWDYKEGVNDSTGARITSDDIDGTEISAGLGMTFFSVKNIDFRFEIIPSIILWDDKTDNDLDHNFNPSRLVKFKIGCDFYIPE